MSTTSIERLSPLVPSAGTPAPNAANDNASPAFRTLLDSLQRLIEKQPKAPQVDCPDSLREALRDTDQVFAQAMDLRKRLEDAFRARLP
jgi:hypothetical protein